MMSLRMMRWPNSCQLVLLVSGLVWGCQQSAIDLEPSLGITTVDIGLVPDTRVFEGGEDVSSSTLDDTGWTATEDLGFAEEDVASSEAQDVVSEEDVTLPPEPGTTGDPCEDSGDCESGFCVPAQGGKVCTEPCLDECPLDWECKLILIPGSDPTFLCLPPVEIICRPCVADEQCAPAGLELAGYRCLSFGEQEGSFCTLACEDSGDCEEGYQCRPLPNTERGGDLSTYCIPEEEVCACSEAAIEDEALTACAFSNVYGSCAGIRSCGEDGLSECLAKIPEIESCNGADDDCDGLLDEDLAAQPCEESNEFGTCSGISTCEGGKGACQATVPQAEICNEADDDCDGAVDEGMVDSDGDGVVDCTDPDLDGDGVLNEIDNCPETPNPEQGDLDGDALGDLCDEDLDGDGSANEADNCPEVFNADQLDIDLDGVGDACESEVLPPCEQDCDCVTQGAISEWTCGCNAASGCDTVWECVDGLCAPVCGFEAADPCNEDDDADGIVDVEDNCPLTPNPSQANLDGDDSGDLCDDDDDNDGVGDTEDNCPVLANTEQLDTDEDGLGDACDTDDDGDGIPDDGDASGDFADQPCAQGNLAGCDDNCRLVVNEDQTDTDSDGVGDVCDGDLDGDGIPDPGSAGSGEAPCHDGVLVGCYDNCPTAPNPGQEDLDKDAFGDLCDEDDDNDAILDSADNCSKLPNTDQSDIDADGIGDVCDTDDDGDGIPDLEDNCPADANSEQSDIDGDGLGAPCDMDIDGDDSLNVDDCAPYDVAIHPGAFELCNGIDDNCDTKIDDEDSEGCIVYFQDSDFDSWGDEEVEPRCLCEADLASGFIAKKGEDCDDEMSAVNPFSAEQCNGYDDNCDGSVDEGFLDTDEDALADCVDGDLDGDGVLNEEDNCVDLPNPGQENIDGDIWGDACEDDDDNDGFSDEDDNCPKTSNFTQSDIDEDGVGDACDKDKDADELLNNGDNCPEVFNPEQGDFDGDGLGDLCDEDMDNDESLNLFDCAPMNPEISPAAQESCNGLDDDCDGGTDEEGALECFEYYRDLDGDGWGQDESTPRCLCEPDEANDFTASKDGDCDDFMKAVNPDATEVCNTLDDNCDGAADGSDSADLKLWFADEDKDQYGDPNVSQLACDKPLGFTQDNTDCDDSNALVFPEANEFCNGYDDDCDEAVDEEDALDPATWYADVDGDTYGDPDNTTDACSPPEGYVGNTLDCDDSNSAVNPDGTEVCDGIDNDCTAKSDDGDVCPCPVHWDDDEHPYMFCNWKADWYAAREYCYAHGYHMLTINDEDENLWSNAVCDVYSTQKWWLGYNDIEQEGTFVWEDGSDATYTFWGAGEPNNYADNGGEDCTQFNRYDNLTWNDEPCSFKFRFVCEAD